MAAARNRRDAAADAVDKIYERNPVLAGEVFDESALAALAPLAAEAGAAFDRVILAADRNRAAADFADAGRHTATA
jgi:hypothetical protein